ncbi:lipopolysaccharide biosynthesis protein [Duganella sp. LX47W]|uniref:Lipopolysaccharide biosynthesis protein n=2 Tax=Rugamonas apoptosis TaxID=2758570 RepID=A0A7W2F8U6_9BURK|nr:lipopolysaccharide biosynthesis protein [Rugamonas apoptosis]
METTRRSFLYSFAEKYTSLLLSTAGAMVISRVLTPAEIGVYSVGAVLVGLAQVVRDFGVGQFLIQERQLTDEKLRAALTVSIGVAWLLAALVWLASGPVATFYHEPRLRKVLVLLACNFLLLPFGATTLVCLRRAMRFSAIYAINTVHSVVQLGCTLALALLGWSYLSLAWGAVAATGASLLASLYFRPAGLPWLPGWRGVRGVLSFGALATGGGVVDEIGVAAPELIIGKFLGVAEVGLFGKAMGLLNVFNQLITGAVSPVIFPWFSMQARAGQDVRAAYLKTLACMTALAWPFFSFVALTAGPLLRLLYGPQWDAAQPLIRIMCFSSAFYSMFSMARYLFVALGQVRMQATLDAQAVPARVAAVLLATPFGLAWVAWAVVFGALFRSWLTWRCLVRLTDMTAAQLLAALWRSAIVTAAAAGGAVAMQWTWQDDAAHPLPRLLASALACLLCWLAAVLACGHPLGAEIGLAGRKSLSILTRQGRT